ncbi:PE-PPE domain-containing protein [Mycolicibacterium sp. XJ2546]
MFRPVVAVVLGLFGTVVLAVAWTAATAVQLAATALVMGGSGHTLGTDDAASYVNPYMSNAIDDYINQAAAKPTGTGGAPLAGVGPGDDRYAVVNPAQFFPVYGSMTFDRSVAIGRDNLNSCMRGTGCLYNDSDLLDPAPPSGPPVVGDEFVVFGYSQSAVIASLVKRDLIANPGATPPVSSFFLLGNPMRPNGGILARGLRGWTIPIIDVTFSGPTPTNSCDTGNCMPTVDVAGQYDFRGGDAPASVTNVLAWLNAVAGSILLHGPLQNADFSDARYQGSYGDTDYYLYVTERLPILMPFEPFVPSPILTFLDAPLRAAIEGGYARHVNPGVPTKVSWFPFLDPVQTIVNIVAAIPVGIDDALAEVAHDPSFRPLGTKPVTSPFGVGGPELPEPPSNTDTEEVLTVSSSSESGDEAPEHGPVDELVEEPPEPETDSDATDSDDLEDSEEEDSEEEEVVDEDTDDTEHTEAIDDETSEPPTSPASQDAGEAESDTDTDTDTDSDDQAAA